MDCESFVLGSSATRTAMRQTFQVPWPMVVTSDALARIVRSVADRPVVTIPCVVDTGAFYQAIPVASPARTMIGFPARIQPAKNTGDAVRALELVRQKVADDLHIWCFGHDHVPGLPTWVDHVRSPTDDQVRDRLNRSRIFLVPSLLEGFGLPGAEAMVCGATLVSTRNGGVDAYAVHRESALLSRPGDPHELAKNVLRLLRDDQLRQRLARRGAVDVNRRAWTDAAAEFEAVLHKEMGV